MPFFRRLREKRTPPHSESGAEQDLSSPRLNKGPVPDANPQTWLMQAFVLLSQQNKCQNAVRNAAEQIEQPPNPHMDVNIA